VSDNKSLYVTFCQQEKTLPIFMQNWWLDAVCTEGGLAWDVALAHDSKGDITAALTYAYREKWGFKSITVPYLTKYTGIWQRPLVYRTNHENIQEEQNRFKKLLSQLPDYHHLTLQLSPDITDYSVFKWAGFKAEMRYLQMLLDIKDIDKAYLNLNRNCKRNIKKAEQFFAVEKRDDFDLFYALNNAVFNRQNKQNPIPYTLWKRLDAVLHEKNQRQIFFSIDDKGEAQGAFYAVFDNQYGYALANGLTELGREQGAMSQLTWEAIKESATMGLSFNFLGSMLPSVELFNRGFNTHKKPYFVLTKSKNTFYRLIFNVFKG
jgi:hypothetical protein